MSKNATKLFIYTLNFSGLFIITQSIIYFLYKFSTITLIVSISTSLALAFLIDRKTKHKSKIPPSTLEVSDKSPRESMTEWGTSVEIVICVFVVIVLIYLFKILADSATTISMRSPFEVLPRRFFALIGMVTFTAIFFGLKKNFNKLTTMAASGLLLVNTTIAAIIYKIGYGFDPFIHEAGIKIITQFGVLNPKTPYYIGEYVTIAALNKISNIPVDAINKFLVPILFPLIIVPLVFLYLRKNGFSKSIAWLGILGIICLTTPIFIMTTPYGFGLILTIATVFLLLLDLPITAAILAVAAALSHPIAGIAALLTVGFWLANKIEKPNLKKAVVTLLFIGGALAIPIMLLINSQNSLAYLVNLKITFDGLADFKNLIFGPNIFTRRFFPILDLAYAFRIIRLPLILLGSFFGYKFLKQKNINPHIIVFASATCLAGYILMKVFLNFDFLIYYEKNNYTDRLFEIAILLLIPLFITGLARFLEKIKSTKFGQFLLIVGSLSTIITACLYFNYPRKDLYETINGWSTSGADIKTVRSIADNADQNNYIVLASQPVVAAQMREFGFKKYYYNAKYGDVFYYSSPTGGILYQSFLAMHQTNGSRETAGIAANIADVKTVYFVVNNYWTNASKTISAAQKNSNESWNVDNTDFIFKYVFK